MDLDQSHLGWIYHRISREGKMALGKWEARMEEGDGAPREHGKDAEDSERTKIEGESGVGSDFYQILSVVSDPRCFSMRNIIVNLKHSKK